MRILFHVEIMEGSEGFQLFEGDSQQNILVSLVPPVVFFEVKKEEYQAEGETEASNSEEKDLYFLLPD